MIRISSGLLGSGKTLHEVIEMHHDTTPVHYYSNILTQNVKKNTTLTRSMIITKKLVGYKNKRSGDTEAIYEQGINTDFWKNVKKPVSILIDEAHEILNSREFMSSRNKLISKWVSLLRRIVQDKNTGYAGELILITQNPHKIDKNIRDLCTQVRHHTMFWVCMCEKCGAMWHENSQMPEKARYCPACQDGSFFKKFNYRLNIKHFENIDAYDSWDFWGNQRAIYKEYNVYGVEGYFNMYDTLQLKNLFEN